MQQSSYFPQGYTPSSRPAPNYVQPVMTPMYQPQPVARAQPQQGSNWPLILVSLLGVGLVVGGGVILYRNRTATPAAPPPATSTDTTTPATSDAAANGTGAAADGTGAAADGTGDSTSAGDTKTAADLTETDSTSGRKKEVFHVRGYRDGKDAYEITRSQADGICKSFNAELATKSQLDAATKDGAGWCSCGWVKDDMKKAYFPGTGSKGCGAKNQVIPCEWRNTYNVNCYGVKPNRSDTISMKADVSLGRPVDIKVVPFNIQNEWSEWGYGEDVSAEPPKEAAQMKPIELSGWEHAV